MKNVENSTANEALAHAHEYEYEYEYETETCSRCGGGGQYSYCQMYGTTCFKCHGKGKSYTMRGLAAIAHCKQLRSMAAKDIEPGMYVWYDSSPLGGKHGWLKVTSTGVSASRYLKDGEWHPYYEILSGDNGLNTFADQMVQAVRSNEQLAETKRLALAYQATLTKMGKPRKGDAR